MSISLEPMMNELSLPVYVTSASRSDWRNILLAPINWLPCFVTPRLPKQNNRGNLMESTIGQKGLGRESRKRVILLIRNLRTC